MLPQPRPERRSGPSVDATASWPSCRVSSTTSRARGARARAASSEILAAVENLSTENVLALLNLAASLMPAGESYVEVGSYAGASMLGAMRGNDGGEFVAIDQFGGRGWLGATRREFDANLAVWAPAPSRSSRATRSRCSSPIASAAGRSGSLFWDADHSHAGQLRGLRAIERHLAPRALVICDNADWSGVERRRRRLGATSSPRHGSRWSLPAATAASRGGTTACASSPGSAERYSTRSGDPSAQARMSSTASAYITR